MPTIDPQLIIVGVQFILSVIGNLNTTNTMVTAAISAIEKWLPTIVSEIPSLYDDVVLILDTLRGGSNLSDDTVAKIDALRQQLDAESATLIDQVEKE